MTFVNKNDIIFIERMERGEGTMKVDILDDGGILNIKTGSFSVPFVPENYGFFVYKDDQHIAVELQKDGEEYNGFVENLNCSLRYEQQENFFSVHIRIENQGKDFSGKIGFHVGVDTYMEKYPEWNDKFFPTLLRCEKTHLWGYYMNTAENALAVATSHPVASYDIQYNKVGDSVDEDKDCGHRIPGTDILFYQNTILPKRHPEHLKIMKAGEVYNNTIYFIPVEKKADIKATISKVANVPVVDAEKYTKEWGECLDAEVLFDGEVKQTLILPDGTESRELTDPLTQYGRSILKIEADNGKQCEASFFVRKDWGHYLKCAAENALSKPPKATTNCESFYGLFSAFLYYKHTKDVSYGKKAYAAFEESMGYMFDLENCVPITIPKRIQNTSCLISLLVDMYEAEPEAKIQYLEKASRFAEILLKAQDETGAYRNKRTHYTCVVYIAKSMLELAEAERSCGVAELQEKATVHYASAKRAVDELVRNLDNIQTEGEMTLEDGMISCSALQIALFALTLPEEERAPYVEAAEYMMKLHSCLEQQLIPDCRCNGASLRYWESQYDVMIRVNMLNSPHGWTGWTGYAKYYLYLLTGKKEYLVALHNVMGSCVQLVDENGNLRWAYCSQPYIKGRAWVPDYEKEVRDGYQFVEPKEKAYRGKYVIREFSEQYVDMISGWYRIGEQKVTGGYEFCPLILDGKVDHEADRQGGCCDNDVHEVFKCMEETVLKKAYIYENEDGTFLTYGCKVQKEGDLLKVELSEVAEELIYNLKTTYLSCTEEGKQSGFGTIKLGAFNYEL